MSDLEKLERATADARAVLTELRGTLKDVKQARKEVDELLRDGVQTLVATALWDAVRQETGKLSAATTLAIDMAVAKVSTEFGKLERLFLGTDDPERPSLPDLIATRRAQIDGGSRR